MEKRNVSLAYVLRLCRIAFLFVAGAAIFLLTLYQLKGKPGEALVLYGVILVGVGLLLMVMFWLEDLNRRFQKLFVVAGIVLVLFLCWSELIGDKSLLDQIWFVICLMTSGISFREAIRGLATVRRKQ